MTNILFYIFMSLWCTLAVVEILAICKRLRNDNKQEHVNHPQHYSKGGRKECIVEMEEKYGIMPTVHFCLLNAYKYLYRAGNKDNNSYEQDRKKAKWYVGYANRLLAKTDYAEIIKSSSLYLDVKELLTVDYCEVS